MSRPFLAATFLAVCAGLTAFARAPQAAPKPAASATWLVSLDLSAKWDTAKMPQEQVNFAEHVAGVHKLASEGTMLVGGPLLESAGSHSVTGAIWIVKADSEEAAKKLTAADPWVVGDQLKVTSVRAFQAAGGAWLTSSKPAAPPAK